MSVLKFKESIAKHVKEGVDRRLIHANDLMMAIIDFSGGPWDEPEPFHQHIHEQATYVAQGEIIFYCEDETPQQLVAGDMFCVPSNKKHGIKLLSEKARLIDSFNPIRKEFLE